MRNLKLLIEYDGSNYCGWQIQGHQVIRRESLDLSARNTERKRRTRSPGHQFQANTIQETIEKAVQKILHKKVKLIVSGRTDAGVHALGQVANFKTSSDIPADKLRRALNALLANDVTIIEVSEVPLDFHSRFYAKSKVYRYAILNRPFRSSFLTKNVYLYNYPLNVKLMRKETQALLGKHDFKSFCASGSKVKNTVRTIKKISVSRLNTPYSILNQDSLIVISIEADGFLYKMVRNIVGTLIEIGRGKFPQGSMKRILKARDRKLAGPTAPACGLCLLEVKY